MCIRDRLWITPFNDFSGNYGTTALNVFPEDTNKPLVVDTREAYVVDENTIFFYAGAIKEKRLSLIHIYIGFESQEILIKDKKTLTVIMQESKSSVLDEVVITGTGEQKKITVTGAVSDLYKRQQWNCKRQTG